MADVVVVAVVVTSDDGSSGNAIYHRLWNC